MDFVHSASTDFKRVVVAENAFPADKFPMPSSRLTDLVSDWTGSPDLTRFPAEEVYRDQRCYRDGGDRCPASHSKPVRETIDIVGLALFRWLPEFRNSFTGYAVLQRSIRFFPADSPNLDE